MILVSIERKSNTDYEYDILKSKLSCDYGSSRDNLKIMKKSKLQKYLTILLSVDTKSLTDYEYDIYKSKSSSYHIRNP